MLVCGVQSVCIEVTVFHMWKVLGWDFLHVCVICHLNVSKCFLHDRTQIICKCIYGYWMWSSSNTSACLCVMFRSTWAPGRERRSCVTDLVYCLLSHHFCHFAHDLFFRTDCNDCVAVFVWEKIYFYTDPRGFLFDVII